MKKFLSILLIFLFTFPIIGEARSYRTSSSDIYVKGYYKKNGTYVAPYYKTRPDSTKKNNYGCIDSGKC